MTRQISLYVNNFPVNLDYFVENYIDHVAGGIVASLKDTGEIESLELNIDNEGQVTMNLNNADVPLKYFPEHHSGYGLDTQRSGRGSKQPEDNGKPIANIALFFRQMFRGALRPPRHPRCCPL
jgi:hypothetical protein